MALRPSLSVPLSAGQCLGQPSGSQLTRDRRVPLCVRPRSVLLAAQVPLTKGHKSQPLQHPWSLRAVVPRGTLGGVTQPAPYGLFSGPRVPEQQAGRRAEATGW